MLAAAAAGEEEEGEALLHLKGQTLFKLGRYAEASDAFAGVVETVGWEAAEADPELMTNVYAAFVAAGKGREALARFPVDEVGVFVVKERMVITHTWSCHFLCHVWVPMLHGRRNNNTAA